MSGGTELGNQKNYIFTSQSGTLWRSTVQLWITQTLSFFLLLTLFLHVIILGDRYEGNEELLEEIS